MTGSLNSGSWHGGGGRARGRAATIRTTPSRARIETHRTDEGGLTAFVLLLLVSLVALLGLVVDGGAALTAHQSAQVEAEQAARSGAGALSVDALRTGAIRLDAAAAVRAAEQFTTTAGHPGTATVDGGVVTVHVQYVVPTVVLGIVGIDQLRVSAGASAENLHGVTSGAR
jgi:Flp pilus assembly protein TadG